MCNTREEDTVSVPKPVLCSSMDTRDIFRMKKFNIVNIKKLKVSLQLIENVHT